MFALVVDGHAVAVCASVRHTSVADEAGVDTAASFRGRGFAGQVAAAWAQAVRAESRIPLYSTSWQNDASRAVARKLGLAQFGSDLHLT
jgi:predicted GNAT family acetyltransferase